MTSMEDFWFLAVFQSSAEEELVMNLYINIIEICWYEEKNVGIRKWPYRGY